MLTTRKVEQQREENLNRSEEQTTSTDEMRILLQRGNNKRDDEIDQEGEKGPKVEFRIQKFVEDYGGDGGVGVAQGERRVQGGRDGRGSGTGGR